MFILRPVTVQSNKEQGSDSGHLGSKDKKKNLPHIYECIFFKVIILNACIAQINMQCVALPMQNEEDCWLEI